MALPPQFTGHQLGSAEAPHSLEIYLDYVCPSSKKIFKTIRGSVWPLIEKEYGGAVRLIFRQQVQPWHATSTVVHESALAFERLAKSDEKFFEYSEKLFDSQEQFFDEAVETLSRRDILKQLIDLATPLGVSAENMRELLYNGTEKRKNSGNKVTNDLKLQIRFGRINGIHVSPTVVWDGIPDDSISSSWTLDQWRTYLNGKGLEKKVSK